MRRAHPDYIPASIIFVPLSIIVEGNEINIIIQSVIDHMKFRKILGCMYLLKEKCHLVTFVIVLLLTSVS